MLRHLPFYDLLAAHPDRHGPEWTEGTAALLLLRLFDDWIGSPTVDTLREGGVPHLRHLISKIANPEVRRLLDTALMVLRKVHPSDSSFAAGALLAYAEYLDETEWYALGADVLATVLEILPLRHPVDFRLAATTYERLAYALKQDIRLAEAECSYDQMALFAILCSDRTLLLKREMYRATLHTLRGNFETTESLLRIPIEQARKMGDRHIEAWGVRESASALVAGGYYKEALRQSRYAHARTPDKIEQEWVTGDIAACLLGLGQTTISRPIHQRLTQTAQRRQLRILSHANLLETAVIEGDRSAFLAHWKKLSTQRKPLHVSLFVDLVYAQGVERWHGHSQAVPLYTAVAERADTCGANGYARQARAHL